MSPHRHQYFFNGSHPNRWEVISHCGFDLHFPNEWNISSCAYWSFEYLLWRNVYLSSLLVFELYCLRSFCCCYVVGILYIFWILISIINFRTFSSPQKENSHPLAVSLNPPSPPLGFLDSSVTPFLQNSLASVSRNYPFLVSSYFSSHTFALFLLPSVTLWYSSGFHPWPFLFTLYTLLRWSHLSPWFLQRVSNFYFQSWWLKTTSNSSLLPVASDSFTSLNPLVWQHLQYHSPISNHHHPPSTISCLDYLKAS